MKKETKDLYPIYYKGKKYTKENTDSLFSIFYNRRDLLRSDNSVYMGDGVSIAPNGKLIYS